MYTIEFQKRGLPHAHIIVFLHRDDKFPEAADIDEVISAEIPDQAKHPGLHEIVKQHMIHGPCGSANRRSPCMVGSKCSKYFPKKFNERTTLDGDGYPIYKRRDNGVVLEKSGAFVDNGYVVPYNAALLLKYRAHINVEWCNQSRAIKYLFKYINKGSDRVTAQSSYRRRNDQNPDQIDEIKRYYDCRYISPCEAVWRIFRFKIHYRSPGVERLSFHLPDEQHVVFNDDDQLDAVIENPSITKTKFLKWMDANRIYPGAANLTYPEFPTKFVWSAKHREWSPRKKGFKLGRLYHVSPTAGERYYLRTLLNIVKGPTCYEEIRTINGSLYPTFKEACYALGLLGDDKEYFEAIEEASHWGSGVYLRRLFSILLLSGAVSRPADLFEKTWKLLSDDIQLREVHRTKNNGL